MEAKYLPVLIVAAMVLLLVVQMMRYLLEVVVEHPTPRGPKTTCMYYGSLVAMNLALVYHWFASES